MDESAKLPQASARVPRIIDGINVRRPRSYGDTGEEGWHAEMQYPVQRQLVTMYRKTWKRYVYVRPRELIIPRFAIDRDKQEIWDLVEDCRLISTTAIPCAESEGNETIILEFSTRSQANKALQQARRRIKHSKLRLFIDHAECHVVGRNAFTTTDILLVREDFLPPTPSSDSDQELSHANIDLIRPKKRPRYIPPYLAQFDRLRLLGDSLRLSSNPLNHAPMLSCPQFVAISSDALVVGEDVEVMQGRHVELCPVGVGRLPEDLRQMLQLERVRGYTWKAASATQEAWRKHKGCLVIPFVPRSAL